MTYAQAQALGIAHLFPAQSGERNRIHLIVPPAVSAAPADGFNKLERAFWEMADQAKRDGTLSEVYAHSLKLRVIGNRWYIPDFATVAPGVSYMSIWETKGFMREDAELKLIAAAERYPHLEWVLVKRNRRKWECRNVTARGISREIWCPEWLR